MTLKEHIKTNSSVKKVSKNPNWLKSYGILKLPIVSKISNRMAGNSKLRSLYLLDRLCFFDKARVPCYGRAYKFLFLN